MLEKSNIGQLFQTTRCLIDYLTAVFKKYCFIDRCLMRFVHCLFKLYTACLSCTLLYTAVHCLFKLHTHWPAAQSLYLRMAQFAKHAIRQLPRHTAHAVHAAYTRLRFPVRLSTHLVPWLVWFRTAYK